MGGLHFWLSVHFLVKQKPTQTLNWSASILSRAKKPTVTHRSQKELYHCSNAINFLRACHDVPTSQSRRLAYLHTIYEVITSYRHTHTSYTWNLYWKFSMKTTYKHWQYVCACTAAWRLNRFFESHTYSCVVERMKLLACSENRSQRQWNTWSHFV